MSAVATLKVNLEDLCCILCEDYLSCSPIRLMANGFTICGRCTPAASDSEPIYRDFTLESLLRQLSFPCCFKESGCAAMVPFDQVIQHEFICKYKRSPCPLPLANKCNWKGTTAELHNHFTATHANLVKDSAEFRLKLGEDSTGVLMVVKDSFPFIVKYLFDAREMKLKYDVRLCVIGNGYHASCKIELANDSDKDCMVGLKAQACGLYDVEFSGLKSLKVLNLNKFIDKLGDPRCIIVLLKLRVVQNAKISEGTTPISPESLLREICQQSELGDSRDNQAKSSDVQCMSSEDVNFFKHLIEAAYPSQ